MLPKSIAPSVIVMLVAADLLIFPHVTVAGVAFWSLERLNWTAALNVTASAMRLGGLIVIVILHRPTVMAWAIAYLLSSVLSSGIALGCALCVLGKPHAALRRVSGELWEGFQFSVGLSAQTIYNDIDKTMLARLSTLTAAGVYGAAYRLIDVAFVPVGSLLSAALPTFFRQGTHGIGASLHYGWRLLKQVLPYPVVAFLGLLLGARLIPMILGQQYEQAVGALRWLAILPLIKTGHYFIANSLTGAGYQGLRTVVQVGVAVFNIGINLWVIPSYGWRGAAWSSIASDSLLALGLLLLAQVLAKRASSPCDSVGHTAPEST
jgi:O-antigen/teichoic acid export membrane protein